MEIKDLFSHKIHSSGDDWSDKLIDIATIFSEFDGKPYDRKAIEARLSKISPRASKVARDPSKFRDEISAYPAYLGLYRVALKDGIWHIFISETTRRFLVCEEPNVSSFMVLQLTLFQYPNGMGIAYQTNSNNVRIQSNTRDRTLEFVKNNIHLSPLRLICKGIQADSFLRDVSLFNAALSRSEVFILANHPRTNSRANPNLDDVICVLEKSRNGTLFPPQKYESRFHILKHTNLLVSDRDAIRLRRYVSQSDRRQLEAKLNAISAIQTEFRGFDKASSSDDLLDEVRICSWGDYFDGIKTLSAESVEILTNEDPKIYTELQGLDISSDNQIEIQKSESIYEFKPLKFEESNPQNKKLKKPVYADPEITRIKRQRANLNHKIILEKLYSYLKERGVESTENEHIDLFAQLPSNGEKFIFEVKSTTRDNLLSQSRKGISQLYEYRFRYQHIIGYDVILCLVFPNEPTVVSWLQEYMCLDRKIGVIWFDEKNQLCHSLYCRQMMSPLTHLEIA
ncbi:MAG: hypothetical protein AAGD25_05125 [Cyanobacteria bacterium P01_F01_bin.150]